MLSLCCSTRILQDLLAICSCCIELWSIIRLFGQYGGSARRAMEPPDSSSILSLKTQQTVQIKDHLLFHTKKFIISSFLPLRWGVGLICVASEIEIWLGFSYSLHTISMKPEWRCCFSLQHVLSPSLSLSLIPFILVLCVPTPALCHEGGRWRSVEASGVFAV